MLSIALYLWLSFFKFTLLRGLFLECFFCPCDVFQIIPGACQVDRHPSFSSVSFSDGSNAADGFELGLRTTGPFYLTVEVLSPELSLSWRLKPLLKAHQWYKMKNDNSNGSTGCVLDVRAKLLSGLSEILKCTGMHVFTVFQCVYVCFSVCLCMPVPASICSSVLYGRMSATVHTLILIAVPIIT